MHGFPNPGYKKNVCDQAKMNIRTHYSQCPPPAVLPPEAGVAQLPNAIPCPIREYGKPFPQIAITAH